MMMRERERESAPLSTKRRMVKNSSVKALQRRPERGKRVFEDVDPSALLLSMHQERLEAQKKSERE